MKKTKAQPSAEKADEKNINGKNIRNSVETVPSDIRVKDGGESVPEFKKVLYGYDADEVNAYIDEMNKTHAAADNCRNAGNQQSFNYFYHCISPFLLP